MYRGLNYVPKTCYNLLIIWHHYKSDSQQQKLFGKKCDQQHYIKDHPKTRIIKHFGRAYVSCFIKSVTAA